jgi:hypothetical protein
MMRYFNDFVNWLFALSRAEFLVIVVIVVLIGVFCMRGMGLKQS